MELMRLQKFLAQQGIASRRKAEDLIRAGKITVNGEVAQIGQKIDPDNDEVQVFSKYVKKPKKVDPVVYAFHKPIGVTSTTRFFKGEKNVMNFFSKEYRLYPAGRLDKESRGLMIMTNDGDIAHQIMHPSFPSEKEYIVVLDKPIDELSLYRLRKGIKYEGVEYNTISVREIGQKKLRFVLGEGKKRQIRMMLRACGYQVRDLFRKRINNLEVGTLKPGQKRKLTDEEIEQLLSPTR